MSEEIDDFHIVPPKKTTLLRTYEQGLIAGRAQCNHSPDCSLKNMPILIASCGCPTVWDQLTELKKENVELRAWVKESCQHYPKDFIRRIEGEKLLTQTRESK